MPIGRVEVRNIGSGSHNHTAEIDHACNDDVITLHLTDASKFGCLAELEKRFDISGLEEKVSRS
ncbi:MAG: hypothetical protein QGD92_05620 [Gammaproteobacteria bacterium]|nr:hypothetical protein [Gammaproteobacteria bacterium]